MIDSNQLLTIFISGLILPVVIYHLYLLIKTGNKIHYFMIINGIAFTLYELFFSPLPDYIFKDTKTLYYMPVFEFGTILLLIYGFSSIINGTSGKNSNFLLKIYAGLTGALVFFFTIFISTRGDEYFAVAEKFSMALPALLALLSYVLSASFKITRADNLNITYKSAFILFVIFTFIQTAGYLFVFATPLKYFFYHLPVVIYLMSLSFVDPHVTKESTEDTSAENSPVVDKILTSAPQEETKKSEPPKETPPAQSQRNEPDPADEVPSDIDFSSFLKRKITIYNELKDTFTRINKAIKDGIVINAKKSDAENFIHAVFTFIRNSADPENDLYITLTADEKSAYLSIGDFRMDTSDKSLNMDKVRLTEIRNHCTALGGKITIGKNLERNTVYLRIKVDFTQLNAAEPAPETKKTAGQKIIFIISDSDETISYINKITGEIFHTVPFHSGEEAIDILINEERPELIISAMTKDEDNQEFYYSLERMKELSNIPLIIVGSDKKPEYLTLKNYRLIPAVYISRPIDQSELTQKIEHIFKISRVHKERNIHKIQSKIEKTDDDKENNFRARFDERCLDYGFNEKEKMIILYLLKGIEYSTISQKTGIKTDDLLGLIDGIFNKTGVGSRIELIDIFIK